MSWKLCFEYVPRRCLNRSLDWVIDLICLELWELKIIFAAGRIKFNVNFLKISIITELWTGDSNLLQSIIAEGKIIYENIFLNVLNHFIKFMFNWEMLNVISRSIKFWASLKKQHNIYYQHFFDEILLPVLRNFSSFGAVLIFPLKANAILH